MKKFAFLIAFILLAGGCAHVLPSEIATLQPTAGNNAKGTVVLSDLGSGVVGIKIDLTGVPPGPHGFHIHENRDCGNNGLNAGGHFNPRGLIHGAPDAESHHAGDFGNVIANASGEVHTDLTSFFISLQPGLADNPLGRAVEIDENPDDLTTQPSGNSGPPIACGVLMAPAPRP